MKIDAKSVTGKQLQISEQVQLLVIGAGPAGCAAARKACAQGAQVMLVDEHPIAAEVMGEHVPQLWGGRMGAQVANRAAMLEQVLNARPELAKLFDMGVDVRLGTACWGLFANQPNMGWMPGPVAGLIDAEAGNRLVQCERVIVATGRRDMGLAFPGWDTPGVAGLHAAQVLTSLYSGFSGSSAVVLGGTNEAVSGALALHAAGVQITGIVETSAALPCDPALADQLGAAGIPVHLSEVPRAVIATAGEVSGLQLRQSEVACDTILLGVGAVPMVDLLQAAGARCEFRADLGGFVPVLSHTGETTLPGIFAVGDCAGIPTATTEQIPDRPDFDLGAYRKAWVRDTVVAAQDDMPVCLCETVTARDILEVRPPDYLNAPPRENTSLILANLLDVGPPDPDQVKRLTRAGMGACQGRRCREQVQALLALQDDLALGDVPLAGYRAPVRPVPLNQAALPEDPAVTEQWDPWMGIPLQWAPYWHIGSRYTVASLKSGEEYVNE